MQPERLPPETTSDRREAAYDALMQRVRAAHRTVAAEDNARDAHWLRLGRAAVDGTCRRPTRWRSMWLPLGIAAAGAVLAVFVASGYGDPATVSGAREITTAMSPQVLEVVGGHRLTIGAESHVAITLNDADRFEARVLAGSAHFEVKPRTSGQSFEVMVGEHRVSVRGTAFRVTRGKPYGLTPARVDVEHGRVAVDGPGVSVVLGAGQHWVAPADVPGRATLSAVVPELRVGVPETRPTPTVETDAVPTVAPAPPVVQVPVEVAETPEEVAVKAPVPSSPPRVDPPRRQVPERPTTPRKVVAVPPEPLSTAARDALLAAMGRGECGRVEKALAAIVETQGSATPAEVWWMKGWCARKRGDVKGSRALFERTRGRVGWPMPTADELPPLPR